MISHGESKAMISKGLECPSPLFGECLQLAPRDRVISLYCKRCRPTHGPGRAQRGPRAFHSSCVDMDRFIHLHKGSWRCAG